MHDSKTPQQPPHCVPSVAWATAGCFIYIPSDSWKWRSTVQVWFPESELVEFHFSLTHRSALYFWRLTWGGTITSCWQYKLDWLGADNIIRNDILFSSWPYLYMTNCFLSLPTDTLAPSQTIGNAMVWTIGKSFTAPERSLSSSNPDGRLTFVKLWSGRSLSWEATLGSPGITLSNQQSYREAIVIHEKEHLIFPCKAGSISD